MAADLVQGYSKGGEDMAGRLAGKVALISGGARGQGEAEARLFVQEGAAVVLGDILVAEGQQVATDLRAQGGHATFVPLEVTQEQDWQQAVETTVRTRKGERAGCQRGHSH